MEPPDEEPKKLSNAARLSEALASTSITIFGDETELNWAVCQALSKKIGMTPGATCHQPGRFLGTQHKGYYKKENSLFSYSTPCVAYPAAQANNQPTSSSSHSRVETYTFWL